MVLDREVILEIQDKKVNLCLPIKVLFKLERELNNKNLMVTLANQPLSMEDLYTIFKYCVIGGNNKDYTTEEDYEDLFLECLDELTYINTFNKVIETMTKSGVLGNVKKTQQAKNQ